jgi:hypothetical protein
MPIFGGFLAVLLLSVIASAAQAQDYWQGLHNCEAYNRSHPDHQYDCRVYCRGYRYNAEPPGGPPPQPVPPECHGMPQDNEPKTASACSGEMSRLGVGKNVALTGWSPTATPPNWGIWMSGSDPDWESAIDVDLGLRGQIWKAQNRAIQNPEYRQWKVYWSRTKVCVNVMLRCTARPNTNPLNSTCTVLNNPRFERNFNPNSPTGSYWVFLDTKVLPLVLPNDSVVPPWPNPPDRGPFPTGSQGVKYDQRYNVLFIQFPYSFTLVVKPFPKK